MVGLWGGCMHSGVQAYVRDNASCSRDNMQRVLYIIDAFPRPQTAADGQNDALEQCTKVTLSAIKWAKRSVLLRHRMFCEDEPVKQISVMLLLCNNIRLDL